jgi:CBS domain-containing protein
MKIKDIMSKHVESAGPDDTIKEAARKMKDIDSGILPVCEKDHIIGIITDRDIVVRSTAKGQDPHNTKVRDVMSTDIRLGRADEDVEDIAVEMEKFKIRRVPVVSDGNRVVGMLSLGDILTRGDKKTACEIFEKISEGRRH